jgi:hypothetical protein
VIDNIDWPALERMFPCRDYGVGFWAYVGTEIRDRAGYTAPPRDTAARGLASVRGAVTTADSAAGEFETRP